MSTHPGQGRFGARRQRLLRVLLGGLLGCAGGAGCAGPGMPSFTLFTPQSPPPPVETLVLRGDSLVEEQPPPKDSPEGRLAGAHELFRRGEYPKAADLYHSLRNKKRFPEAVIMEATYYEAECLRLQARYPKAADTYSALLKEWPSSPFREQAALHMYEIANFWLEDTRVRMVQTREKRDGKRMIVDQQFLHFDKTKPLADEEGRAIEKLEQVHYADIDGSLGLGDRALFQAGAVNFFNENYSEADHFLTLIHENYPDSPLAPQAVELAIISKTLSTGGPDYDGRKVAEARVLVDSALRNYPELNAKKAEFLSSKLAGIQFQQAEKDYRIGEFYRRTGHLPSAWFYYRLVERRYPNTDAQKKATQRIEELRVRLEKKGKPIPTEGQDLPVPKESVEEETAPEPRRLSPDPGPPPGPLPPSFDGRPLR